MMSADLADMTLASSLGESFRVQRRGLGEYVDGHYFPGPVTMTDAEGAIWPASGREMLILPEGVRTRGVISIATKFALRAASEPDGHDADVVEWNGDLWEVHTSQPWASAGYRLALAVKRLESIAYAPIYYGVAGATLADADAVVALGNKLSQPHLRTAYTVTTGAGEYGWFCAPATMGTPRFEVDGWQGGAQFSSTIVVDGVPYDCWRDTHANLGAQTVKVTQ